MQPTVLFCNVIDLTAGLSFYCSFSIGLVLTQLAELIVKCVKGTSVCVNQRGTLS